MFTDAESFNIDISKWDVSRVQTMDYMFFHWKPAAFNQTLCGAAWVRSKASKKLMFVRTFGSIPSQVCTLTTTTPRYVLRRPIPERELAPLSTITLTITSGNEVVCQNCGTFKKFGRVSCCAPGGDWFKKCGGVGNGRVGHSWSEGAQVCKRKSNVYRYILSLIVSMFSPLSFVQCPHTGSDDDDCRLRLFKMRHHQEIRENQLLWSRWFLVRKLRKRW